MDADLQLHTVHEEMLSLVELHRIQKKCSVKNSKIKRLSNLNFLPEIKNNFNSRVRALQNFNVYIKYRSALLWSGKPSSYLAKTEKKKL